MQDARAKDNLATSVQFVVDAETFGAWVRGPLTAALPSEAVLCGLFVAHAGGHAALSRWAFGLPQMYLEEIQCVGHNIRSPILDRLIEQGRPTFFDAAHPGELSGDPWFARFKRFGWYNLLGLVAPPPAGEQVWMHAGFYNVHQDMGRQAAELQRSVLPHLRTALMTMLRAEVNANQPAPIPFLNVTLPDVDQAIVELLAQGKTNKEIGKELNKSDQTIKHRVARLCKRFDASSRTELVVAVLARQ